VELTVNANELGVYALVIELQSGEIQVGDGAANVSVSEEGAISLTCDNSPVFENGMRVWFPDDNAYTATVLGSPIDPVLAVVDDADTGFCYDDSLSTRDDALESPNITIDRDTVYPQAIIAPDDASLVFGGWDSAAGSYILLVEGGSVSADDEGDVFEISLTP